MFQRQAFSLASSHLSGVPYKPMIPTWTPPSPPWHAGQDRTWARTNQLSSVWYCSPLSHICACTASPEWGAPVVQPSQAPGTWGWEYASLPLVCWVPQNTYSSEKSRSACPIGMSTPPASHGNGGEQTQLPFLLREMKHSCTSACPRLGPWKAHSTGAPRQLFLLPAFQKLSTGNANGLTAHGWQWAAQKALKQNRGTRHAIFFLSSLKFIAPRTE